MKDIEDPDPTVRDFSVRALPNFGPAAGKKDVSALLLKRMNAEKDPVVRYAVWGAVGAIPFEHEPHNGEAIRLLSIVIDTAVSGGQSRSQAVQAITMFGPRAEGAITALTGQACADASYETRRLIANALGRIGFNEKSGPNMKALTRLADTLARDESAAVRMEALQSLMLLGPPWAAVKKADDKMAPPVDAKSAAVVIKQLKLRVGDPKQKLVGLEKDKQVEIWGRLVLMRFDPAEINEDNLEALARHLTTPVVGVRVQALQAIAFLGPVGAKKLDAVVRILWEKDQPVELVVATLAVLRAMGAEAKPSLPELRKFVAETRKDVEKIGLGKPAEKLTAEELQKKKNGEELVKLIDTAIKDIEEAKQVVPLVDVPKKP
jgi:hypothetical protein